ncbi:MAG: hypothetical protein HKN21_06930, partial [Candidatus Eisenbacteria bacterium]|nr:hypothetical protein [Candidatus Eisenbacteria bacterium]
PQYNQFNRDRILLGKLLFYDPILSGESAPWVKSAAGKPPYRFRDNDMACASCHHPDFAFADGRRTSAGVGTASNEDNTVGPDRRPVGPSLVDGDKVGTLFRNAPTLMNTAYNGRFSHEPTTESLQFLDGRIDLGLEVQALDPLVRVHEMAGHAYGFDKNGNTLAVDAIYDSVAARVRDLPRYFPYFANAYPGEIESPSDIHINHITKALAAFERELITPNSRYDQFVTGTQTAFTAQEKKGFQLFFGKAQCGTCHYGPMLSDYSFHVQGVAERYEPELARGFDGNGGDLGRYHANPSELADQKYAFRTLSLRNIEQTAPYFHSGSAATLRDVMEFHNRGGLGENDIATSTLEAAGVSRHPAIVPLGLTDAEMESIIAFLKTTTADVQPGPHGTSLVTVPERLPSGLLPPGVRTPAGDGPWFPNLPTIAETSSWDSSR